MPAQPLNLKHPRPDCGISGWAAAWSELDKISDDRQRTALSTLVRGAGFRGAPALRYCAELARYKTGLTPSPPVTPEKLKRHEAELVESRVREGLVPYADRKVFPFIKP